MIYVVGFVFLGMALGAVAALKVPLIMLRRVGFGPHGIEAGSKAAKLQSESKGCVLKGGPFANMQRRTTKGFSPMERNVCATFGAAAGAVVVIIPYATVKFVMYMFNWI